MALGFNQKPIGSTGKRFSTSEPLTEHDVAARIQTSGLRLLKMLREMRDLGMQDLVRTSRYWPTGLLELLRDEIDLWLNNDDDEEPGAVDVDVLADTALPMPLPGTPE